jgi:hypothetical protein
MVEERVETEPEPGSDPLIVETVMVEMVSPFATILDVTTVEPVSVDIVRVLTVRARAALLRSAR